MTYAQVTELRRAIVLGSQTLPPSVAKDVPLLYDDWDENGHHYYVGVRIRYGEEKPIVYETREEHNSQSDWTPDIAHSLYKKVGDEDKGDTPDNPIEYETGMELFNGKYYSQNDVVYVCFRDTEIPVYNDLKDLVHIYVEVYEG